MGIDSIVPAASTGDVDGTNYTAAGGSVLADANLAALVALLVILFFGVVLFSVLCCCMKGWVAKASATDSSKKAGLLRSPGEGGAAPAPPIYGGPAASVMEDGTGAISPGPGGGGTDNPLWIDQKFKVRQQESYIRNTTFFTGLEISFHYFFVISFIFSSNVVPITLALPLIVHIFCDIVSDNR